MMIDKITGANPLTNLQNTKRANSTVNVKPSLDKISVSEEAKAAAEAYYLNHVAEETPDVRAELVEQIKQKIQDPNYLNEATIAMTAERILSAYGF